MKVLQLKIWLLESDPEIWRLVLVPESFSLEKLHEVIQGAFGWENCHLHEFRKGARLFGLPDPEAPEEQEDERHVLLREVFPRTGSNLEYEYDFGDSWVHGVALQRRAPAGPGLEYPVCVDGGRAGPPEDLGGIFQYNGMVAAFEDPEAPDRDEVMEELAEWVGDDFDPAHFDLKEANLRLGNPRGLDSGMDGFAGLDVPELDDSILPDDERLWDYDGDVRPDPDEWLDMDEQERILAVQEHHERDNPHLREGDQALHASLHAVVENQLAMADPPETRPALVRLVGEGLPRHDAIHAIASVLSDYLFKELTGQGSIDLDALRRDYANLTKASWHARFEDVPERPARRRKAKKGRKRRR